VFVAANVKERTMQYGRLAKLIGALAAAVLVAACSSGANSPTSVPTLAPAAETAAPVAPATPEGMFTGSAFCPVTTTPSGGDPDAMYHRCTQVATDPRMAGTVDLGPISVSDYSELEPAFTSWGPSVITNDRGSWTCQEAGRGSVANGVYARDLACTGKGEYIGLSAWLHAVTGDGAMNWSFIGWID
jgi:hypothetical protein